MTYHERLFASYRSTHGAFVEGDDDLRAEWFRDHYARNYRRLLPPAAERPRILEIGAGRGFMLAALRGAGYGELMGVDLSPDDVAHARERLGLPGVVEGDGRAYLRAHPGAFDVVLAKAVLEHVRKEEVLPFLDDVRAALAPGGRAILEVPNMDWILAGHERFMDFTHEVGFTRESLGQVLRCVFGNAEIRAVEEPLTRPRRPHLSRRVLRPVARVLVGGLLLALGDGAAGTLWQARSIIGLARREAA